MNRFIPLAFLAVVLMLATPLAARADLVVSTGSEKGTYYSMLRSVQVACSQVPLTVNTSTGSDENLDRLVQNQATLGVVQSDTLKFQEMNDPRVNDERIRVLAVLHPEEVHVVVSSGVKVGGSMFGLVGGRLPETLADLRGKDVGAWGGSYTTAMVMNLQGNLGLNVIRYGNGDEAKAAMEQNRIQAIIAVGGQPLGFVSGLDRRYRLLSIGDTAKFSFYVPAKLNYRRGTGAPRHSQSEIAREEKRASCAAEMHRGQSP